VWLDLWQAWITFHPHLLSFERESWTLGMVLKPLLYLKMTMDLTIVIKNRKKELYMQTINASVFKAKCLRLMEEVNESGEEIVILKNGKPISKLVPYKSKPRSLFGLHQSSVRSRDDLIEPADMPWDVEQ
jgi:antitoxin (DNA-binding transcriptional repressor) of toxin-antitoxin stability system